MRILYIPIGSFCHPKILIRETHRSIEESLPFDFHSTPHMSSIVRVFQELHETQNYTIEYKDILSKHVDDQLVVKEKNDMYIVHFFYEKDLKDKNVVYPCDAVEHLHENKKKEVKEKMEKRFQRLLKYLYKKDDIVCFLRIENYENNYWHEELKQLTYVLQKFNAYSNKYLIYTNPCVYPEVDFRVTNQLSYNYFLPVLLYKGLFTEIEMTYYKQIFIDILEMFEGLMHHPNVIEIEHEDHIEKYYIDMDKNQIFKLSDIHMFSSFYIKDDTLYIKTGIYGYQIYKYQKEVNRYVYKA